MSWSKSIPDFPVSTCVSLRCLGKSVSSGNQSVLFKVVFVYKHLINIFEKSVYTYKSQSEMSQKQSYVILTSRFCNILQMTKHFKNNFSNMKILMLKGYFTQKYYSFPSFQNHMIFKEDIMKMSLCVFFLSKQWQSMAPMLFWLSVFFKISYFMFVQFWNNMWMTEFIFHQ